MPAKRFALLIAALLYVNASVAQVSPYYAALVEELQDEYGISGGTFVFGENESGVLGLAQPSSGVQVQPTTPSGQGFTRGLRLTVAQAVQNPWERTVRFPSQQPIQQGDALLLVMWLRCTWPDGADGLVQTVVEKTSSPYTKSLEGAHSVDEQWQRYIIPFEAAESYAAGEVRFQLNAGYRRQMIEIAGLAIINYGDLYEAADLPHVTPPPTYEGREPGASWRAAAASRIEQHRKGGFDITVRDAEGQPVEGARVRVRMRRHAFNFGTAVAEGRILGTRSTDSDYRRKLENLTGDGRTFNAAVFENGLKWDAWEEGWAGSPAGMVSIRRWLADRGMRVRGHNLIWPGWDYLPADIQQYSNDPAYVTQRIEDHIAEVAGYPGLKGELYEWDVLNEPAHLTDLRDVYSGQPGYPSGEEVYSDWFRLAEAADSNARLFINEYNILSYSGPFPTDRARYKEIIQNLIDDEVKLNGIGLQGHMHTPLTPIDTLFQVLEDFSAFGRDLAITEYDASGVEEELAGDYMRDFLTVVFSHPSVSGFLMWGFWDGAHWKNDAPMFRQDWSLKPSGAAFLDLVFDQWWTDTEMVTDAEGRVTLRGFLGDYELTAEKGDLHVSASAMLSPGEPTEVELAMTSTDTGEDVQPRQLELEPNFPDPFPARTTIRYALPHPAAVELAVFDATGRLVRTLVSGVQPAGRYATDFDAAGLASGVYLYRLIAGDEMRTGRMVLVRN